MRHVLQYTHKRILHKADVDEETGESSAIQFYSRDLYVKDAGHLIIPYGMCYTVSETLREQGIELDVLDDIPPLVMDEEHLAYVLRDVVLREMQAEALALIATSDRAQIVATMGWGKSFTIRLAAAMFPHARVVVACPSIAICQGMYKELTSVLPCVGLVGGGRCEDGQRIVVCTYASLRRACARTPDVLFIDECHGVAAPKVSEEILELVDIRKIFGFTGTPEGRSDGAEPVIEAICGPISLDVTYKQGVEMGAVVPNTVHVKIVTDRHVSSPNIPDPGYTRIQKKRCCYWNNAGRDAVIAKGIDEVLDKIGRDSQVLVLVEAAEHALRIQQHLPGYELVLGGLSKSVRNKLVRAHIIPADYIPPSAAEVLDKQNRFSSGELRRVIATGKWKTGVDFKGLHLIVQASGEVSPIGVAQAGGRVSRTDGVKVEGHILDTFDDFSPWSRGRSQDRLRVYRKIGWKVPRMPRRKSK